jgi:hypothetical protein
LEERKEEMEQATIGNIGERYATNWLRMKGYRCRRNTQLPGSSDIEAVLGSKVILVQVKTSMHPNLPSIPDMEERSNIISRAKRNGYQAWIAQVVIDRKGQLVGKIKWLRLA